jgi:GT2 family glycosyltransferase
MSLPLVREPPSSLVISSRNRAELLADTISSVLAAAEVPSELIVVDQSDRPNAELAQLRHPRCDVRYLWTAGSGASRGRNYGASQATHPIVAFIDDDMRVAPDWYGPLIRAAVDAGPHAAATGRVLAGQAADADCFVIAVHAWQEPQVYAGRIGRDVLATGHMALYRSALEAIGGLDERLGPGTRFPGAEDNDLGFRLLEAGYRIVYTPDSVIYHRSWRRLDEYVPLFWRYGRGQGAFYAKHFRPHDWYMGSRLRQDLGRFVRLLPRRLRRRQFLELAGSSAFLAGAFAGGAEWMLTQRWVRA